MKWPNNASKWWISQGQEHIFRRVRIKLNQATRDGATIVHILTNLPRRITGKQVAELYRKRWTLETAFQHLEAYFHSEINTLGYPKAALFGFCLALVAYNLLAVVLAALRGVHGEETVDEEVSSVLYRQRNLDDLPWHDDRHPRARVGHLLCNESGRPGCHLA